MLDPPFDSSLAPRVPLARNVKLLGWASCLNDVASEMIYPLLPDFLVSVLGGSRLQLGLIEGVADSAAAIVKLASGGWSDWLGRRKAFVVSGYALATVARPAIGLLVRPWQLGVARLADRVGKGVRTAPRDALIADSSAAESRGRAFGFQRAMDHLGAAIGPLVAVLFLWWWPNALRELFLLAALPGMAVVALLIVGLREIKPAVESPRTGQGELPSSGWRVPEGVFRRYLVAIVVFTLGNSTDAFLLIRAGELGVPRGWLPALWCAFHVVKSGGSMLSGPTIDRAGARPVILGGWLLYAAVYLAFGAATSAWQAWALFLAYGVYYALAEPAEKTWVANLVGTEQRGLAYGWFNAAVGCAALPSSVIFGALYEHYGARVAFGWGAGLALVAALSLLRVPNSEGAPTSGRSGPGKS